MGNDRSNTQAGGGIVLAVTILGSSMAFVDGTVVNVALPALQSVFHASISDVQWVVESYALMLAALLLVGGSLGDIFGRRKVYVLGVALFAVASAGCGAAPNTSAERTGADRRRSLPGGCGATAACGRAQS